MKNKNQLDKIDHIAIQVNDIKKSAIWYEKKFGCKLIYIDKTWALIAFKNINLALVTHEQHPPHFAILDDLVNTYSNVNKHRDGSKSKYIKDNDLNFIELITYKKN